MLLNEYKVDLSFRQLDYHVNSTVAITRQFCC